MGAIVRFPTLLKGFLINGEARGSREADLECWLARGAGTNSIACISEGLRGQRALVKEFLMFACGMNSDEIQTPNRCKTVEAVTTVTGRVAPAFILMAAGGYSLGNEGRGQTDGDTAVFA